MDKFLEKLKDIWDRLKEFFSGGNTGYDDPTRGFSGLTRNVLIIAACVLVVVGAGTYAYVAHTNGSLYNFFVGDQFAEEEEETTVYTPPAVSGNTNIAVCVTTDSGSKPELFFVLGFDMDKKCVSCINLPLNTDIGGGKTVSDSFSVGNTAQVIIGVEDTLGITVDRFMQLGTSDLERIISHFTEEVNVDLADSVNYSSVDYSLNLQTGPNSVNAETYVNLLRYNQWEGGVSQSCAYTEQFILNGVKTIFGDVMFSGGQSAYETVVKYCDDTSVALEDYSTFEDAISVLCNTPWRTKSLKVDGSSSGGILALSSESKASARKALAPEVSSNG